MEIDNLKNGIHKVLVTSDNGVSENVKYYFPIPGKLSKTGAFLDNTVNYYYSRNGDSAVIVYFQTFTPIVGYYYLTSSSYSSIDSGTLHYVPLSKPTTQGALLFTYPQFKLNVRYYLKIYTVDENGNIGVIGPTHFNLYSQVNSYATLQTSAEYNAVEAGSSVTVSINVKNLEDLMGMNVEVTSPIFDSTPTVNANSLGCSSYNKEVMSVISKTATDVKAMIGYADVPGKSFEHFTANGNILTITWNVPKNTKPGIYPVYMFTPKFVNQKDEPIDGVHVEAVSYILVK